jgi:hypothetical protein
MSSFFCGFAGVALFIAISPALQLLGRITMPTIPPVAILAFACLTAHALSSLLGATSVHPFAYWNAAAVFCFGVMSYVYVFGAVYKSISLRILMDLTRRPARTIEFSEISDRQIPEIFNERSAILLEGGLVDADNDTFVPTPAGRRLAAKIARTRRLFAIGDTGLYDFDTPKGE